MLRLYHALHPPKSQVDEAPSALVLSYHDMRKPEQDAFRRQLELLRAFGDFADLSTSLRHLQGSSGRVVCLTFDDGYRGAFDHALPVLVEQGIPATFFVVPGWIDDGRPDIITWDQCRILAASGMEIGSHSLTHRRLSDLATAEVARELSLSRQRIEAEINTACVHFACPWGQPGSDYNPDRDPSIARDCGYLSFMTTIQRRARQEGDQLLLPRVRMEPDWGSAEIRYAISRA